MIFHEYEEWSWAQSIVLLCFSISVSAQLSVPVRVLICFSSFFSLWLTPHRKAWNGERLERRSNLAFFSCGLRLNWLHKTQPSTFYLLFLSNFIDVGLLHCFNPLRDSLERRMVMNYYFFVFRWCLQNFFSVHSGESCFPKHHWPPSSHLSIFLAAHSALLSLVCFWQSFVFAAVCIASFCHYHRHASDAGISFIYLTNALGKILDQTSKTYFEAVSFHCSRRHCFPCVKDFYPSKNFSRLGNKGLVLTLHTFATKFKKPSTGCLSAFVMSLLRNCWFCLNYFK